MKRFIIALLASICACCAHTSADRIRQITGTITGIDSTYIYIDTVDYNGWVIDLEDGYSIGDNVIITFDNMGTADIYDDELVQITRRRDY
jgi:hypothetical protein